MDSGREERQVDGDCPPKKPAVEEILKSIAPVVGNDFLSFDTNGYDFIASTTIDPIPTGIPIFVTPCIRSES